MPTERNTQRETEMLRLLIDSLASAASGSDIDGGEGLQRHTYQDRGQPVTMRARAARMDGMGTLQFAQQGGVTPGGEANYMMINYVPLMKELGTRAGMQVVIAPRITDIEQRPKGNEFIIIGADGNAGNHLRSGPGPEILTDNVLARFRTDGGALQHLQKQAQFMLEERRRLLLSRGGEPGSSISM